jgi:hypothetical protein
LLLDEILTFAWFSHRHIDCHKILHIKYTNKSINILPKSDSDGVVEQICAIIGIQNSSTSERNAMKEP